MSVSSDPGGLALILAQTRRIWRDLASLRRDFWLAMAATVLAAAAGLLLPARVQAILTEVLPAHDVARLSRELGLIVLIAGASIGLSGIRRFVMERLCLRLVARMRQALFSHVLSVPPRALQEAEGGQILTGFTNDLQMYRDSIKMLMAVVLPSAVFILVYVGAMIWFSWLLSLLLVFVVLPLVLATNYFARRIHAVAHRAQASFGRLLGDITDTLRGTREIKLFGMQDRIEARFQQANDDTLQAMVAQEYVAALHPFVVSVCVILGVAVIAIVSVWLTNLGLVSGADLTGFVVSLGLAYPPIQEFSHALGQIAQLGVARDRLDRVHGLAVEPSPGGPGPVPRDASVTFDDLGFSYGPGAFALQGINLTVAAGEHVALVGASGSGKSTLIEMLPRFHTPQDGQVRLGGVPIDQIPLGALRGRIGLMSQVPFIFRATLWENLTAGAPDASRQRVLEVAERARVDEFAARLPQGYDTPIEPGGTNLSVGQRQRLAIARVLLKDPPILLLDEPTSALDAVSERLVSEAIAQAAEGRTTITVAHRLSTVRSADRIIVLDRGRIAEIGTHATLLAKGGLYAALVLQGEMSDAAQTTGQALTGAGT